METSETTASREAFNMNQFRKKPVVIEAFQMTKERRNDNREWPEWLNEAWNRIWPGVGAVSCQDFPTSKGNDRLVIATLEGIHTVDWDDWIIRGIKGELYPCKPDIFVMTYEAATAPQAQPESVDAELLAALKWAAMFYPRDGEDSNEKFERIGSVFHAETGYLCPGKDSVLHSFVEQERAWATWIKDKQRSMRLVIQRAESAKQSASRQIVTATLPGSSRPTHRSIPPDDAQSAPVAGKTCEWIDEGGGWATECGSFIRSRTLGVSTCPRCTYRIIEKEA